MNRKEALQEARKFVDGVAEEFIIKGEEDIGPMGSKITRTGAEIYVELVLMVAAFLANKNEIVVTNSPPFVDEALEKLLDKEHG